MNTSYYVDTSYGYNAASVSGLVGGLLVFMVLLWILAFAISIFMIITMWKLFKKLGKPGWASIIPIYNVYVLCCEVAQKEWWYILLLCVPIVQLYAMYVIYDGVAKKFGKETGFVIGMMFLPIIFFPILAFSKDVSTEEEMTSHPDFEDQGSANTPNGLENNNGMHVDAPYNQNLNVNQSSQGFENNMNVNVQQPIENEQTQDSTLSNSIEASLNQMPISNDNPLNYDGVTNNNGLNNGNDTLANNNGLYDAPTFNNFDTTNNGVVTQSQSVNVENNNQWSAVNQENDFNGANNGISSQPITFESSDNMIIKEPDNIQNNNDTVSDNTGILYEQIPNQNLNNMPNEQTINQNPQVNQVNADAPQLDTTNQSITSDVNRSLWSNNNQNNTQV